MSEREIKNKQNPSVTGTQVGEKEMEQSVYVNR